MALNFKNNQNFSKKFYNKQRDYNRIDKIKKEKYPLENEGLETIKLKDAIKLVSELDTDVCCGCECKMLFDIYAPYCVYQFSFDRIDNKKIHATNNLRVVCWNCNSSGYGSLKLSCSRDCHINLESKERPIYFETGHQIKE